MRMAEQNKKGKERERERGAAPHAASLEMAARTKRRAANDESERARERNTFPNTPNYGTRPLWEMLFIVDFIATERERCISVAMQINRKKTLGLINVKYGAVCVFWVREEQQIAARLFITTEYHSGVKGMTMRATRLYVQR